jgi:hypothetical protein
MTARACCHRAQLTFKADSMLCSDQADRLVIKWRICRLKAVVLSENCSQLPLVWDFMGQTRGYYGTI